MQARRHAVIDQLAELRIKARRHARGICASCCFTMPAPAHAP
jgi:hypothetical protein